MVIDMYQFTEDCLTGIETIDEEHRQLFAVIGEAFTLLQKEGAQAAAARNLIQTLRKYAATHFAHEESYMEQIKDPELPRQQKEHREFADKVNGFSPEEGMDEEKGKELLEELLEYLSRWLYHHILGSDIMIGKIKASVEKEDYFAFTDKYRTGIEMVDEQHRRLFEIIAETNDLIRAELLHDKYDEIMKILGELRDYTVKHFHDEEEYMERIGYDGLERQRNAHQAFVDKLNGINLDEVDDNQQQYLKELVEFLLGWLVNHILKMDKMIPVEA